MLRVDIYTDGGCRPNPGKGAWAALLRVEGRSEPIELHGSEKYSTNNRMELMAVIQAIGFFGVEPTAIAIHTDSQYVKLGVEEWLPRWLQNGWRTSDGNPVKNQDLWEELNEALQQGHTILWYWVRGHNGDRYNELVDRMVKRELGG